MGKTVPAAVVRRHLRGLCGAVETAIVLLDKEMRGPSTVERGERIAAVCNALELVNDSAKHFGLGMSLGRRVNR